MSTYSALFTPYNWVKGRKEVFPLFAVVAFGMGLVSYSCSRHLFTNPDLHVNKQYRIAGPVDDNGLVAARAAGYASSIFREYGEGKKKTVF